jgi:hydrogenase nickel incorporation protein HypA/HybF
MHEASIAEGILKVVTDALAGKAERITKINVVAGALSGVEGESLTTWFGILAQGTPAQGAAIHIRRINAHLVCRGCGKCTEYTAAGPVEVDCPDCGKPVMLEGGTELYVDSVEIE